MTPYTPEFYAHRHESTVYSAEVILPLVLKELPPVHAAIDIGCGVGTWLSVLRQHGVADIHGCDGDWVDRGVLSIPPECFEHIDLSRCIPSVQRRYDLAISLEVAEHLPATRAAQFVSFLTALADHVLFSAAIPGQGGTHHVNEQWPRYWAELFEARGYRSVDCIRPHVWHDAKIPFWYRQNALLFVNRGLPDGIETSQMPLDLVHPELYRSHTQPGVRGSFKLFCQSMSSYFKKSVS